MTDDKKIRTVTLDEPLARGDASIAQLRLRKPAAGELRGLKLAELTQLDVGTVIKLLPRITLESLTEAEAATLAPEDLLQCAVEIGSFFLTRAMQSEIPDQ